MRRFKDNILKDKKFLKDIAIILIFGILINAFCFFIGSFYSKAAIVSSNLPFIVPIENDTYNESEVNNCLGAISQAYPDDDLSGNYIVFKGAETYWWDYSTNIPCLTYSFYFIPENTNSSNWGQTGSQITPTFDSFTLFSNDYIDWMLPSGTRIYSCTYRNIGTLYNGVAVNKSSSTGYRRFFSGELVHIENAKFDFYYYQNYPVYSTTALFTNDNFNNQGAFLSVPGSGNLSPGEFSDLPPLEDILNNISNSFNPHTNDTPPTYDSSISEGQNISNAINGHSQNINNAINNLGNNIKNWFDNIQRKLTDTTNAILGGIHNGFATLNQNFKDFFGAKLDFIIEKLDYITQEFDSSTVLSGLDNTDFKQDFDSLLSMHEDLEDMFDISEPTEYHLVLHLGQIDDDFISLAGDQEIDISFLHNSSLFRTFAWCIVVSGLAFIVASGIPSMLRGDKGD